MVEQEAMNHTDVAPTLDPTPGGEFIYWAWAYYIVDTVKGNILQVGQVVILSDVICLFASGRTYYTRQSLN